MTDTKSLACVGSTAGSVTIGSSVVSTSICGAVPSSTAEAGASVDAVFLLLHPAQTVPP